VADVRVGSRRSRNARRYPWSVVAPQPRIEGVTIATTPAVRTVRVLVVDDHPALRAGLEGLLRNEPGIESVGALDGTVGLLSAVQDLRPDVVVLDYALGADDGLSTCFRVKQQDHRPAVVLYSAYVDDVFTVPALIAQADATVSKSAPIDDLLSAIHAAAAGTVPRRALDPERIQAASARLLAEDVPIATMLLVGTAIADIADILDTTTADVRHRALRIIGRLQAGPAADGRVRPHPSLRAAREPARTRSVRAARP
jgi:DNA-binding NarL/FixJ family response regulator